LLLGASLCVAATAQSSTTTNSSISAANSAKAEDAYLAGARLLDRRDLAGAQAQFETAAKLNPSRPYYTMAATLTRDHRVADLVQQAAKARMLDQPKQADTLLAEARQIDPKNELLLDHPRSAQSQTPIAAQQTAFTITPTPGTLFTPPIEVQAAGGTKSIHLRGDAKTVISGAASVYGLKTVFDASVSDGSMAQLRVDLDDCPYNRTLPLVLKMAHMFSVALDKKTLLIARDTQENRARLERQIEETIYVPASTKEELNELTNIVKNIFDVTKVAIEESSGTIAVRAPQNTISALNETLQNLIDNDSDIVLEIKLISIDASRTVNTGTQTPTTIGAFNAYTEASSIVSSNSSLVGTLISSGGYVPSGNAFQDTVIEALYLVLSGAVTDAKVSSLFGLIGGGEYGLTGLYATGGLTFNFGLSASDTRALDDVSVRVGNRQTTTLRVGERYPITTGTYSSGVSSATTSALAGVSINGVSASSLLNQYLGNSSATTIPQIQYEDLGITLKTTPIILNSGLVSLNVSLKIEALAGPSLDNIPVLTSSVFDSNISVQDGTGAMMLTNLSRTESASISGLPGLSELPGFQESAADDLKQTDQSELVLMVTPHIVRHRASLTASRRIPFASSAPQEF
jgi:hypothetical protein